MRIFIRKGDITKANVDVIVNAANSRLAPQSGVCGMIYEAAGYEDLKNECNKIGYLKEGNCAITKAYNLNAKYIIHAVGPIYKGSSNDDLTLALTYNNALNLALENKCLTIAFPILSTGLYNYPYELASKIAIDTILEYKKNHANDFAMVYFYCYDDEIYNIFLNTYNKITNDWKYKINDVASYDAYLKEKERLVKVFKDTRENYLNNSILKDSVENSISNYRIYDKDFISEINTIKSNGNSLIIENLTTVDAIMKYKNDGKIMALNFASGTRPGGGVINGAKAQEESLCRASTLYKVLTEESGNIYDNFYNYNKIFKGVSSSRCVYTPNITIFKKDDHFNNELLKENEWVNVDILTYAAPNLKNVDVSDNDVFDIFRERIDLIFNVAKENLIDVLILGAFGCGAFHNNPVIVSKVFKELIEKYKYNFKNIIFAIPDENGEKSSNYKVFNNTLFDK